MHLRLRCRAGAQTRSAGGSDRWQHLCVRVCECVSTQAKQSSHLFSPAGTSVSGPHFVPCLGSAPRAGEREKVFGGPQEKLRVAMVEGFRTWSLMWTFVLVAGRGG